MITHALHLRRGTPVAVLAAFAITAIAMSRFVLRSPRELAQAPAVVPYVVAAGFAAIAARWIHAASRGRLHALSPIELAVTSFVAAACVATLAMPRAPFWVYALLPYLVLGVAFAVARRFVDCSIVRWALAITGAVVAASVLLDAFAGMGVSPLRRPGGLLGNRNFAAEYLALALPAALVLFTRSRRWLGLLLIFGVALALTRCRTAWIAATCATVAVLALSAPATRGPRVLGVAVVVAGIVLATLLPTQLAWKEANPFTATLSRTVELGSGSGELRVRQYEATIAMLGARHAWLTGVGPGGWQRAVHRLDPGAARNGVPHSDYLRVISDGGVPALAMLGIVLLAAIAAAWRRRREMPDLVGFIGVLALVALADAPLFRLEVVVVTGAVLAALQRNQPLARASSCGLAPAAEVTP
jgi:O-antigen ligase